MKYEILRFDEENIVRMKMAIAEYIADGRQLQGGVSVYRDENKFWINWYGNHYFQAIIKFDKSPLLKALEKIKSLLRL